MSPPDDHWKELADSIGADVPALPPAESPADTGDDEPTEPSQPLPAETPVSTEKPKRQRPAAPPRDNHWRLLSNELGVDPVDPPAHPVTELPPSPPRREQSVVSDAAPEPVVRTFSDDSDFETADDSEESDPLAVTQKRFVEEIDDIFHRQADSDSDSESGIDDSADNSGEDDDDSVDDPAESTTTPIAEAAGDEERDAEDPAADDEAPARRRRRRRGRRRRRDSESEPAEEVASAPSETAEEEPAPAAESEESGGGRRRRSRWRRGRRGSEKEKAAESASPPEEHVAPATAPAAQEDDDDPEDSGDDLLDDADETGSEESGAAGRPRHKQIPSWSEAIEVIVAGNLASRERGGRRGRRS